MLLCLLYSLLLGFVTALQGSSPLQLQLQDIPCSLFSLQRSLGPCCQKLKCIIWPFCTVSWLRGSAFFENLLQKVYLPAKTKLIHNHWTYHSWHNPSGSCWGPCLFRRAFPSISLVPLAAALMIPLCTWPCFLQAGSLSLALAIRFLLNPSYCLCPSWDLCILPPLSQSPTL